MRWMPAWLIRKGDKPVMDGWFEAYMGGPDAFEEYCDKQVEQTLLAVRWKRAVLPWQLAGKRWLNKARPYLYIFKLSKEFIHGRYRRAVAQIRGSTNPASGAGAGAAGVPVAQFTGYGGGFTGGPGGASQGTAPGGIVTVSYPITPLKAFEDAGVIAGEVTAYRCWRLNEDGKLYSIYRSDFCWEPGTIAAGDAEAGNGIHAFKNVLLVAEYGGYSAGYTIVCGTVDLWGEVYEHERGYRAQYAAIREIFDSPDYDAEALRKLYKLKRSKRTPRKGKK